MRKMTNYKNYLIENNYSGNTIRAYTRMIENYFTEYKEPTHENLLFCRNYLISNYSVSTANLRINALNSYLRFTRSPLPPLEAVKVHRRQYYDEIISNDELTLLKNFLSEKGDLRSYFLVRILACTGMRISELLEITVTDIHRRCRDIISKGCKLRRVYFPEELARETEAWLASENMENGYIFLNCRGRRLTPSGVRFLLRGCARACGIPEKHIHPHAFRHRYALNFLKSNPDISLLADLLGHESLDTTRLYLKRTQEEQIRIINDVVKW